jgi:hypothetical protein
VLIILILIRHEKKNPSGYPESIRLWTPKPVVAFTVSLTAILGIIRFPSKKKIKSRHPSSLCLAYFVIQLSLSDLEAQVQLNKGVYNGVYIRSLGAMLKHMLMMWS